MVYFIRIPNGMIKIGTSTYLPRRIEELKAKYGAIQILAVIRGGHDEESAIHRKFDLLRTKGTELFSPSQELMDFINQQPVSRSIAHADEKVSVMMRVDRGLRQQLKAESAAIGITTEENLNRILSIYYGLEPDSRSQSMTDAPL